LLSGNKNPKPESQLNKAKWVLETLLQDGEVATTEVQAKGAEQGISFKTLERAKEALGVISIKRNNKWYWQMPIIIEVSQEPQDRQESHAGMLAVLPLVEVS